MPCRSSSRSVCVNIFCEMPPVRRASSPERVGPSRSTHSRSIDHLLPMSARISCDGQSGLNGFALAMAYQAPKGAYLQFRVRELTLQSMWKSTEVTRRLKLDVPIVQGP